MIYLNNAASSYPKLRPVMDAVSAALFSPPSDPYRRNSENETLSSARINVAQLFGVEDPARVIFTSGATESLNLCIEGLVKKNSKVIVTQREHTSTLRPVWKLESEGMCSVCVLQADKTGLITPACLIENISKSTSLVCVNHVSNVNGSIQDLQQLYEITTKHGAVFLVDAAQSAGCVSILADSMPDAVFVFTGHKALLGPSGIGGFVIGKNVDLKVVKTGGSGIHSVLRTMPEIMPLKYEAGTSNTIGIAGLGASTAWILEKGIPAISDIIISNTRQIIENFKKNRKIEIYAAEPEYNPCGIVSFNLKGWSPRDVGYLLEQSFDIWVRTGLHCAPLMADALGLNGEGSIRASISHNTQPDEIDQFCNAVNQITGMEVR